MRIASHLRPPGRHRSLRVRGAAAARDAISIRRRPPRSSCASPAAAASWLRRRTCARCPRSRSTATAPSSSPARIPQIFPGPAINPLVRSRLSERQVQALLERARQAGLLARGRIDYGDMGAVGVSDRPTTTLVVNAAGRPSTRRRTRWASARAAGRLRPAGRARKRWRASSPRCRSGRPARAPPARDRRLRGAFRGRARRRGRTGRVAAEEQSRHRRQTGPNGLAYRCITSTGRTSGRCWHAAHGQRAVALDGSRRREGHLPGGRAAAAPGRARLPADGRLGTPRRLCVRLGAHGPST